MTRKIVWLRWLDYMNLSQNIKIKSKKNVTNSSYYYLKWIKKKNYKILKEMTYKYFENQENKTKKEAMEF